jgi:hypothetical protein
VSALLEPTISEDGFVYDPETGEILGHTEFQEPGIDSIRAISLLEMRLKVEAQLKVIDLQEKTVLANIERMRRRHLNTLQWLESQDEALAEFARGQMPKGSKTWTTPYGSVSLRIVKGGLKVADSEQAANTASLFFPHAFKETKTFQISKLTNEDKTKIESALKEGKTEFSGFEITEDRETISVKTGVKE